MIVRIPRANIHALSSDLLEGKVKLVFTMPLNDETMKLREKLAMLKVLDTPVQLLIQSPQETLEETAPASHPGAVTGVTLTGHLADGTVKEVVLDHAL